MSKGDQPMRACSLPKGFEREILLHGFTENPMLMGEEVKIISFTEDL